MYCLLSAVCLTGAENRCCLEITRVIFVVPDGGLEPHPEVAQYFKHRQVEYAQNSFFFMTFATKGREVEGRAAFHRDGLSLHTHTQGGGV